MSSDEHICKHCGMSSAETKFDMWKGKPRGYQCKRCINGIRRYGLNTKQQLDLLNNQDGKCKLCDRPVDLFSGISKSTSAVIDHCHKTERVRGILCHQCNSWLAFVEYDPENMLNKISKYLGVDK